MVTPMVMRSIKRFVQRSLEEGWSCGICGVEGIEGPSRYESWAIGGDGKLKTFCENQKSIKGEQGITINSQIYMFSRETVLVVEVGKALSFESDIFPRLIDEGVEICVDKTRGAFIDIGTPESLKEAHSFIEQNSGFCRKVRNGYGNNKTI